MPARYPPVRALSARQPFRSSKQPAHHDDHDPYHAADDPCPGRDGGHVRTLNTRKYLHVWLAMFFIVTLQMCTALRPIIGTADTLLPETKKFFLEHWFEEMGGAAGN